MPPPGGRFYDGDPVTAPFSDGHPQIGRRLTGRKQALEALGVYHLVADLRVPGNWPRRRSVEPSASSRCAVGSLTIASITSS
jgi:hypothetical protein